MIKDSEYTAVWGSVLTFLVCTLLIYLFFVPVYWIRSLEDLLPKKRSARNTRSKISRKLPPPYPNGWFQIAESKDVKTGKAISVECLGETFVVFRSTDTKQVFVLDAFCPHLGANLGIGGIVKENCIECPFHSWKFNGVDGSCTEIPYASNSSEKATAKLKKWQSVELYDLIFVWYHAENELPWKLPEIPELLSGDWSFHGKNEFNVSCHIQDIPENGADVAHLKTVHEPSIASGTDIRYTRSSWLSIGNHIWNANWSVDKESKHIANIHLTHVLKIWNVSLMNVTATIQQIGPGCVVLYLSSYLGPMVILQTLTPIEPSLQKLSHYFYGPRYLAWFIKFSIVAESINVSRDVMIWNSKQFISNPILPKEDKLIKKFRFWFGQFYSENSKSYDMASSDLSW